MLLQLVFLLLLWGGFAASGEIVAREGGTLDSSCKCIAAKRQYWADYPDVQSSNLDPVYHYENTGYGLGYTFNCDLCSLAPVLQDDAKCNCAAAQNLYISTYALPILPNAAFAAWLVLTATPVTWLGKVWRCDICLDSISVGLCLQKGHLAVESNQNVTATVTAITSSTAFSVDLWVNTNWAAAQSAFVGSGWAFGIGNGVLFFNTSIKSRTEAVPSQLLESGKWVHFAVSVTTSGYTFFVNGITMGLHAENILPISTGSIVTIGGTHSTYAPFVGQLDNVRIFNSARSQADIVSSMTSSQSYGVGNLILSMSFDSDLRQISSSSYSNFGTANSAIIITGIRYLENNPCPARTLCAINYDTIAPVCAPCTNCMGTCTDDCDCGDGACCINGECTNKCVAESLPCTVTADCREGLCCTQDGVCSSRCALPLASCTSLYNCTEFTTCSGGTCVGDKVAVTAGQPGTPCAVPGNCLSGVCSGTCGCLADTDCNSGSYCNTGVCVAKLNLAASCSSNHQCHSGKCYSGTCHCSQDSNCGLNQRCENTCGASVCQNKPCPTGFIGLEGSNCVADKCNGDSQAFETGGLLLHTALARSTVTTNTGFFASLWVKPQSVTGEYPLVMSGENTPSWKMAIRNNCLNFYSNGGWAHGSSCPALPDGYHFFSASVDLIEHSVTLTTNANKTKYTGLSWASLVTTFPIRILNQQDSATVDEILIANSLAGNTNILADLDFDYQTLWGTANLSGIPPFFEADADGSFTSDVSTKLPRKGCANTCFQNYPSTVATCNDCPNGWLGTNTTFCSQNMLYGAAQKSILAPSHLWHLWDNADESPNPVPLTTNGTQVYKNCTGLLDSSIVNANGLKGTVGKLLPQVSFVASGPMNIYTDDSFSVSFLYKISTPAGSSQLISIEGSPSLGSSRLTLYLTYSAGFLTLKTDTLVFGTQVVGNESVWHNVAFGFTAGRVFFVVDGKDAVLTNWGERVQLTTSGYPASFTIGPATSFNFEGYVAEVAFWQNYALTYADVQTLFNSFKAAPFISLSASITTTTPICPDDLVGVTLFNATGGSGSYAYHIFGDLYVGGVVNFPGGQLLNWDVVDATTGCSVETSTPLPPSTDQITAIIVASDAQCNGLNGHLSASNTTGGTSPYVYQWIPASNPLNSKYGDSVDAPADVYNLKITDFHGCYVLSPDVTITEPSYPLTSVTSNDDVLCYGQTATATTVPTGGTPPYNATWLNTQTLVASPSHLLSVQLAAGTYNATVMDARGCKYSSSSFTVSQPSAPIAISFATTKSSCTTNGSITATVTGGVTPYAYMWSTNIDVALRTLKDQASLPKGNYQLRVTDNNACTLTRPVSVVDFAVTLSNQVAKKVTCPYTSDGKLQPTASGSVGPYTLNWDGYGVATYRDGLPVGSYGVTVTDGNTCTFHFDINLGLLNPELNGLISTSPPCLSASDGSASLNVDGGTGNYNYKWYALPDTQIATTQTASGLVGGGYYVNVSDQYCWKQYNTFLPAYAPLVVTLDSKSDPLCNANSDGSIAVIASGGSTPGSYVYKWTPAGNATVLSTQATVNSLYFGSYTLKVTSTNYTQCVNTKGYTLSNPAPLTAVFNPDTQVSCFGANDGSFTANLFGGNTTSYVVEWSFPNGTKLNTTTSTTTLSRLAGGAYQYRIIDANGCQKSYTKTVYEPVAITTTLVRTPLCLTPSDGSIVATNVQGGTSGYSYKWYNFSSSSPFFTGAASVAGLTPGNYRLKLESGGCEVTYDTTIPSTLPFSVSITHTDPKCNGQSNGKITTQVSGGDGGVYQYKWLKSSTIVSTVASPTLAAGSYTLQLSTNTFPTCVYSAAVTLVDPASLSVAPIDTPVSCYGANDGAINLQISGGNLTNYYVTYIYPNTSMVIKNNTGVLTGLGPGAYTYTIADSNGCTSTGVRTITEPAQIVATLTTTVPCASSNDGTAQAVGVSGAFGNFNYVWKSSSQLVVGTSGYATGLVPDNYTLTITSGVCSRKFTAEVRYAAPLAVRLTIRDPSCTLYSDGSISANVTGGSGDGLYLYQLSKGTFTSSSSTTNGLAAGSYTLKVTASDNPLCFFSDTLVLTDPGAISFSATETPVSCYNAKDGQLHSTFSGGNFTSFSVTWTLPNASTVVTSASDLRGLSGGWYFYSGTDANLCPFSGSSHVTEPAPIAVQIDIKAPCHASNDAYITATAPTGGLGNYGYEWRSSSGVVSTSASATNLTSGNYTLKLGSGTCFANFTVTVPVTVPLVVAVSKTDPLCAGSVTGSISLSATGGVGGYSYAWTTANGSTFNTPTVTGLGAGVYNVDVFSPNYSTCVVSKTVTLVNPDAFYANPRSTPVSCYGSKDGSLAIDLGGGNSSVYGVLWTFPNGTTTTTSGSLTGLSGGLYLYSATDANNCTVGGSYNVVEPAQIIATVFSNTPVSCNGGSDGALYINATGDAPLTYSWAMLNATGSFNVTSTGPNLLSVSAGTYKLKLTSAGVCSSEFTYNISQPDALNITTSYSSPTCASNGTISYSVVGGTPGYYVTIKPLSGPAVNVTGGFIDSLHQDFYTITATDSHSCVKTASVDLVQPTNITLEAATKNVTCFNAADGRLNIVASNGVPPYTYRWEHDANLASPNASNLVPGVYRVLVRDSSPSCSVAQGTYTISGPIEIIVYFNYTAPTTTGGNDGTIVVTVAGGVPPYAYSWSSGSSTNVVSGYAGNYTFYITDSRGCTRADVVAIPASVCGDGFTTGSEECDPPGECCASTCQFVLASANQTCRASVSQCDLAEYCSGTSAVCPTDSYMPESASCYLPCSTTSTCVSGVCTSQTRFDCTGGYCNNTLNACQCANTSMTYPYCRTSCPVTAYGPNCQYTCGCVHGTCFDGPYGNGTCSCDADWYSPTCNITRAPVLLEAKFANDGQAFTVAFDINTNYGGQSSTSAFPCSIVLAESTLLLLDNAANCIWHSQKLLSVSLAGNTSVQIGSPINLKSNTIFADPGSIAAASGSVSLLAPEVLTSPTLALSGPTTVGSCNSIAIIASLQGTLGKPTINKWNYTATTTNTSALEAYLSSYAYLQPVVDSSMLVPGNTYTFSLTVTNVFSVTTTKSITVSTSLFNIPTISISPSTITTYAPQELTIQGSVAIPTEEGCQPSAALVWLWTVVRANTGETVALPPSIATKKNLVIPGGMLVPGATYSAALTGYYVQLAGLNNTATATIIVLRSDLIATIAGGNIRTSSATLPLVVNATNSNDPDSSATGLIFTWTCTSAGATCVDSNGVPLTLANVPALAFPAYSLVVSSTYKFTLVVSTSDGRSANVSVSVLIVANIPPSVSIVKLESPVISSSSKLELKGFVSTTTNTTYYWHETTGQLNLDNRTNLMTSRTNINLVIKPNVLQPGLTYSFVLQATNANGTGVAGVDITVSSLPHGGTCQVLPTSGFVVTTSFKISCSSWEDISSLSYTFSYLFGSQEIILRTQAAESLSTTLPLPSDGTGQIPIIVKISNKYNATASTTFNATVSLPGGSGSNPAAFVKDAFSQVTANLAQYGDPEASIQSLLALSSVLTSAPMGNNATANAEAVALQQQIFGVFASVATNLSDSSAALEQQSGNVAVLSQSSSQWDDSGKSKLADILYSFSKSSSSVSTQALNSLLTGLSNVFGTNSGSSTSGTRRFTRAVRDQNATAEANEALYNKLRDSVQFLTNNVLASMVCGQDNTELDTTNIQITAGKVPRENLKNVAIDVNGMTTKFPFAQDFVGDADCMDAKIALQPTSLYSDSSPDFISQIASVTVGANNNDYNVSNLTSPIELVFPIFNYTTTCVANATVNCSASCEFLVEANTTWSSSGCSVYASNRTHVVCHCSHLTTFAVNFRRSVIPLEQAGNAITHPTFASLRDRPTPILLVALVLLLYGIAMVSAVHYDYKRGFYEEVDMRSPVVTTASLYSFSVPSSPAIRMNFEGSSDSISPSASSNPIMQTSPSTESYLSRVANANSPRLQNANSRSSVLLPADAHSTIFGSLRSNPDRRSVRGLNKRKSMMIPSAIVHQEEGEEDAEKPVETNNNNALEKDITVVDKTEEKALDEKSIEMEAIQKETEIEEKKQEEQEGNTSPCDKKPEEMQVDEQKLKKLESGEYVREKPEKEFSKSLEVVDDVYGITLEEEQEAMQRNRPSKWKELKQAIKLRMKTNHRYFRLFFRKSGDPFSRARRITVLLNVVITCMACNAIFYHAKHSDESISIGTRFLIAFWSSLLIAPVNLTVYFMFSKAGYRYPLMEVPMQDISPRTKRSSFKPSRTLRLEQEELARQMANYRKLTDEANNMTVEQAQEMGGMNRAKLHNLVTQSRADLESFQASVQRRYEYEFSLEKHPPKPSAYTKFKNAITGEWPWWMARVGYVFSLLVVIFSTYIILIYANNFTKAALNGWVLSSAISILQDILLNQPIASVGGAVFGVFLGGILNRLVSSLVGLLRGVF